MCFEVASGFSDRLLTVPTGFMHPIDWRKSRSAERFGRGYNEAMNIKILNCEGLNCPMPIVEMTKAARALESGDKIQVTATDLAFKPDLEAWSRRMNHKIDSFDELDGVMRAQITLG